MIEIKIEGKIVNLYKDDRESPIYQIRKAELPLTITENGYLCSEWISHLMTKTWIEESALYELARIIQNEFPENNINWEETFFPVEKRLYLNHVKMTKKITDEKKNSEVNFDSLMESIEIGLEEQNDEVNSEISKIVNKNLSNYGLK